MGNDSKKNAIEQACEHLGFDFDDTQPVEIVEDSGPLPLNTNVVVLNALESMYHQFLRTYRLTGNALILDYIRKLAHDLGYTDSEVAS